MTKGKDELSKFAKEVKKLSYEREQSRQNALLPSVRFSRWSEGVNGRTRENLVIDGLDYVLELMPAKSGFATNGRPNATRSA